MNFLTDSDYAVVIGDDALKTVSRASADIRDAAEAQAAEEMAGYLRPVYDCDAIFAASGDSRNPLVVMYAADIALYHMTCALPGKLGMEIRRERYERAVKWLEGVQAGKIVPDLPTPAPASTSDTAPCGTSFQCAAKLRHDW